MAGRRRKRNAGGAVVALLCVLGVALILAFGSNGNFADDLIDIWNNTIRYDTAETSVSSLVTQEEDGDLLMYVIDTGNSDSIVLRTPGRQAILVDAADNDDSSRTLATLDALGIKSLAAAVATHPDADHIGSMDDVLTSIPVETIYLTDQTSDTKTYDNLVESIEQSGVRQDIVTAGYRFEIDGVSFTVLNPQDKEYEDNNNSSIVLLVEYGSTRFLLEGDAETDALSDILAQYSPELDIDVLKVGHHGSSNATTEEFLDVTTPELAVITCGKDNDYGHPHRKVTDMLKQDGVTTLRTDQNGDIAIFSDGEDITWKSAA